MKIQWFFLTNKTAYQHGLETLANQVAPLQVISVGYGEAITADCPQRLRQAAARLS